MERRKVAVRILVSLCGALALGLVIFVAGPWLVDEVAMPLVLEAPPEPEMSEEEIVRQALDSLAEEVVGRAMDGEEDPGVAEGHEETSSPLLAVRENGDTLPVLFPRSEEERMLPGPEVAETPAQAAPTPPFPVPDRPQVEDALPFRTDTVIPVAGPAPAPPGLPRLSEEASPQAPVLVAAVHETESVEVSERPLSGKPAETLRQGSVFTPPPGAVGELQELLERLGYEPGPVDGVWGPRTARAWRSFARNTGAAPASVAPEPSRGPGSPAAPGAVQAGPPPPGLPAEPEGTVVPGTLRGVMGYRMPIISRQEVPDQVVSGVLMPAHTTYVILRPGYWELTGLTPEEVEFLEKAAARGKAETEAARKVLPAQPAPRRWNPLKPFRRGE